MLGLGLGALAHAIWHANYYDLGENIWWQELSVLQAAHAAEILIKARIAEEHPLLIFDQLPKSNNSGSDPLSFLDLIEKGRTVQFSDLPSRLWATTGVRLPNEQLFQSFGRLRNTIQHFTKPDGIDFGQRTDEFIFGVIDPFINQCWELFAIDYNEDHEPYSYLLPTLISRQITFLVSPEAAADSR